MSVCSGGLQSPQTTPGSLGLAPEKSQFPKVIYPLWVSGGLPSPEPAAERHLRPQLSGLETPPPGWAKPLTQSLFPGRRCRRVGSTSGRGSSNAARIPPGHRRKDTSVSSHSPQPLQTRGRVPSQHPEVPQGPQPCRTCPEKGCTIHSFIHSCSKHLPSTHPVCRGLETEC